MQVIYLWWLMGVNLLSTVPEGYLKKLEPMQVRVAWQITGYNFYKRLASSLALKWDQQPCSMRTRITFSLLRSAIQYVFFVAHDPDVDMLPAGPAWPCLNYS